VLGGQPEHDDPVEVLLLAGEPLREPLARYGPFVMNSPEEIQQALDDFRAGRMGTL
jgi:redox-sensitive bicupin YhaK (pirin superfamily)